MLLGMSLLGRKRSYIICSISIITLSSILIALSKYSRKIEITSFGFDAKVNNHLTESIVGKINEQDIIVEVPDDLDITSLVASYTYKGSYALTNNKNMDNLPLNYESDLSFKLYGRGISKDYTVHVVRKNDIGKEIIQFSFKKQYNNFIQEDIHCLIDKNAIRVYFPPSTKKLNLVASFETTGDKVLVSDIEQVSGKSMVDYSKPVKYTVIGVNGEEKDYMVIVKTIDTGLPTLMIETDDNNPSLSKSNFSKGTVTLYDSSKNSSIIINNTINIKVRGNSIAGMPKKGYNIVFNKEVEILGLKRSKEYALIANHADKTMLRNDLGYRLSHILYNKTVFNPNGTYVDVFLNNSYLGCYFLSETIEVSESKLKVYSQPGSIGFLIEADFRDKSKKAFKTKRGISFGIKYPENVFYNNDIRQYIQDIKDEIYQGKSLEDINIDFDSLIDWYLANEILKNLDARYMLSVFMYTGIDGRLAFGPVWDFDLSSGNVNDDKEPGPEGFWVRENPWISELFKNKDFQDMIIARWREIRPKLGELFTYVDTRKKEISKSAQFNYEYWDIFRVSEMATSKKYSNHEEAVEDLIKWMRLRIDWLDSQWKGER
jgi:hypothetical protein